MNRSRYASCRTSERRFFCDSIKKQARNFLWENPCIYPQRFPFDANFDNYWCGGWGDAFPTADACVYHDEPYPNLGEQHSLEWAVEETKPGQNQALVCLSTFGPISAIKATKNVSLPDREVEMPFEIDRVGAPADGFPLGKASAFAVQAGTRLIIQLASASSDTRRILRWDSLVNAIIGPCSGENTGSRT